MRSLLLPAACLLLSATLAGCAGAPRQTAAAPFPTMAFAPEADAPTLAFVAPRAPIAMPGDTLVVPSPSRALAGRTIVVERISDIALRDKEVVLTFDDGPVPGRTDTILAALEREGVKATFLMVGQMARSHPATARKVALAGHTIGSHTQNHPNLAAAGFDKANAEIVAGRRSVEAALVPTGLRPAPFFRFPYLADTPALRAHLAAQGTVVIDVDIDSKDYFQSTPDQVRQRTLARIAARGSGIVLFHDLHNRTARMLPAFLADLRLRGYKVVHLVPGRRGIGSDLVASLR